MSRITSTSNGLITQGQHTVSLSKKNLPRPSTSALPRSPLLSFYLQHIPHRVYVCVRVCDRSGHQCRLCESVSERQDEQQCVDTHKHVCKTSVTRRGSVRGRVLKRLLWQLVDWLMWPAASVVSASTQNRHLCMLKPRSPLAAVPMTQVTGRLRIGALTQAVELLRAAAPSETRHYKKKKKNVHMI